MHGQEVQRLIRVCAVIALTMLTACASKENTGQPQRSFEEALKAGASCAELFDIRNDMEASSPNVVRANDQLRSVGCYSSESTRTDQ